MAGGVTLVFCLGCDHTAHFHVVGRCQVFPAESRPGIHWDGNHLRLILSKVSWFYFITFSSLRILMCLFVLVFVQSTEYAHDLPPAESNTELELFVVYWSSKTLFSRMLKSNTRFFFLLHMQSSSTNSAILLHMRSVRKWSNSLITILQNLMIYSRAVHSIKSKSTHNPLLSHFDFWFLMIVFSFSVAIVFSVSQVVEVRGALNLLATQCNLPIMGIVSAVSDAAINTTTIEEVPSFFWRVYKRLWLLSVLWLLSAPHTLQSLKIVWRFFATIFCMYTHCTLHEYLSKHYQGTAVCKGLMRVSFVYHDDFSNSNRPFIIPSRVRVWGAKSMTRFEERMECDAKHDAVLGWEGAKSMARSRGQEHGAV